MAQANTDSPRSLIVKSTLKSLKEEFEWGDSSPSELLKMGDFSTNSDSFKQMEVLFETVRFRGFDPAKCAFAARLFFSPLSRVRMMMLVLAGFANLQSESASNKKRKEVARAIEVSCRLKGVRKVMTLTDAHDHELVPFYYGNISSIPDSQRSYAITLTRLPMVLPSEFCVTALRFGLITESDQFPETCLPPFFQNLSFGGLPLGIFGRLTWCGMQRDFVMSLKRQRGFETVKYRSGIVKKQSEGACRGVSRISLRTSIFIELFLRSAFASNRTFSEWLTEVKTFVQEQTNLPSFFSLTKRKREKIEGELELEDFSVSSFLVELEGMGVKVTEEEEKTTTETDEDATSLPPKAMSARSCHVTLGRMSPFTWLGKGTDNFKQFISSLGVNVKSNVKESTFNKTIADDMKPWEWRKKKRTSTLSPSTRGSGDL